MISTLLSSTSDIDASLKKISSKKIDEINNIGIYLMRNGDVMLTVSDYPSSIVSLLRALSLSDSALFLLNQSVSALDAELMLAFENSGIDKCTVLYSDSSDRPTFEKIFYGTALSKCAQLSLEDVEVLPRHPINSEGKKYVSIDKHFVVKGVGGVIIGFVVSGTIKKGDKMFLVPSGKEVTVKNIQLMDVDMQSAPSGSHVGLALNNATEKDMDFNYAIADAQKMDKLLNGKINVSQFYRRDIPSVKDVVLASGGEAFVTSLKKNGDSFSLEFNKPILTLKKRFVLADPSLSPGKNRIIGNFETL